MFYNLALSRLKTSLLMPKYVAMSLLESRVISIGRYSINHFILSSAVKETNVLMRYTEFA